MGGGRVGRVCVAADVGEEVGAHAGLGDPLHQQEDQHRPPTVGGLHVGHLGRAVGGDS